MIRDGMLCHFKYKSILEHVHSRKLSSQFGVYCILADHDGHEQVRLSVRFTYIINQIIYEIHVQESLQWKLKQALAPNTDNIIIAITAQYVDVTDVTCVLIAMGRAIQ